MKKKRTNTVYSSSKVRWPKSTADLYWCFQTYVVSTVISRFTWNRTDHIQSPMFSKILKIPIARRICLSRGKTVVWICQQHSTYGLVNTRNVAFIQVHTSYIPTMPKFTTRKQTYTISHQWLADLFQFSIQRWTELLLPFLDDTKPRSRPDDTREIIDTINCSGWFDRGRK